VFNPASKESLTMCRLLAVKSPEPIDVREHLRLFARIAQDSPEYQGHGWGCAWLGSDQRWASHHDIKPIWEDDLSRFPPTGLLLAHARSAFRDEGIAVENNMPFEQGDDVFIFNGELHGVRIKEAGRIGAEKIFNFIERFNQGDLDEALRKGVEIILKRTRLVKAMNIIMSEGRALHVSSTFTERPGYFTMHWRQGADLRPDAASRDAGLIICSDPLPGISGWNPIASGERRTFP
jgi:predicted glutamine amidotransferase